jgi:hypothetical protein
MVETKKIQLTITKLFVWWGRRRWVLGDEPRASFAWQAFFY